MKVFAIYFQSYMSSTSLATRRDTLALAEDLISGRMRLIWSNKFFFAIPQNMSTKHRQLRIYCDTGALFGILCEFLKYCNIVIGIGFKSVNKYFSSIKIHNVEKL